MIKLIQPSQLRRGMYLHELSCSWLDHPFASSQFLISEQGDINKIRSLNVKSLKIDTEKGIDVESDKRVNVKPRDSSEKASQATKKKTKPSRSQNRGKGKKIKQQAEQAITTIMSDVKLGKQIAMEVVAPIADDMTDSVLENHSTLLGLSRIRHQDEYTFEHSVNIGVLMTSFAKSRGMSKECIRNLSIGGMLHDIGKTLTPPEVLNKPGKLTDEEFLIMRHHVVDSRLILEKTPNIHQDALDVAALHHEKYDGSGYPDGIKGDEISIVGQMSAIVDVYDALTADRCYHKGQDPSVVLKRMLSWSGSHFNPKLMQEFIHCVGIYPVATLVMLSNYHLAVVVENNEKLLLPVVVIFLNTKSRETISPKLIDLSKQDKLTVLSSESDKNWNVDPQKYLELIN